MSLSSRLSAFFLAALALVLAGFSLSLYQLAQTYLHRQVDERLASALDTLAAVANVKSDEVSWEGRKRQILLGQEDGTDQVRWTVHTGKGQRLDRSRNLAGEDLVADGLANLSTEPETSKSVTWNGAEWRLQQRRLEAKRIRNSPPPQAKGPKGPKPRNEREEDDDDDRRSGESGEKRALILTAGMSLEPVRAALRNLGWALAGLSLGVWLVAAFLGRWLAPGLDAHEPDGRRRSSHDRQRLARAPAGPWHRRRVGYLARAFNDLLGRLQDSFERQRRFTGDASHQLRTPLAAILGQIEVLLRRPRSTEEYQEVLAHVQGQAHQLTHIVEMLLFLARADADARLPQLETLDLGRWLPDHVGHWSDHARSADLHLECPGNGPLLVQAQPPLLGQLVDNLLENACKYSDPGTPITARLAGENGRVVLSVEDSGHGIPAEDLPHVFEPFFRSPQARKLERGGVGLGLTVAQRIAAAFGGCISVQSKVPKGTRFCLELPKAGKGEG